MLQIYFRDEVGTYNKNEVYSDIEELITDTEIVQNDNINYFIENIELGKYNDNQSFIDRFGFKLKLDEMSTGCKVAMCVELNPEKLIDTIECGINALDIIINKCNNGRIIILNTGITFSEIDGGKCSVQLDNYKFTSIHRLNEYIQNERPFKPDMNIPGISKLEVV